MGFAYPSNARKPAGAGAGRPGALDRPGRFIPPRPLTAPPTFPNAAKALPLMGRLLGPWGFLGTLAAFALWELWSRYLRPTGFPDSLSVRFNCNRPGGEWTNAYSNDSTQGVFCGGVPKIYVMLAGNDVSTYTGARVTWIQRTSTPVPSVPAIGMGNTSIQFTNNNAPGAVGNVPGTEPVQIPSPFGPSIPQFPDIPEIPEIAPSVIPNAIPPLLWPSGTPRPLPFEAIPSRPTVPGPSNLPGTQVGPAPVPSPLPGPNAPPVPATDPFGNPIPWLHLAPMPRLAPLPHRPISGTEAKFFIGTPNAVKKLLHMVSEPHDFVDAIHKCVPKKWRSKTPVLPKGRRSPRVIGKHRMDHMLGTIAEFLNDATTSQVGDFLVCSALSIADNEIEDAVFGILGGMVARVSRQLGLPLGIERLTNLLYPEGSPAGNVGKFLRNYAKLPVPYPDQ